MPAAACSKLCSSVSAWSGVFACIAKSSAQSAWVIVFAGDLLLLFFVSSKPFSLILSIDVLSTQSRQMIKRYGASVSPFSTPATMSKYSVSPSGDRTFTLVFLQRIVIAATVSLGMPYASRICSIFPLNGIEGLGKVDKY